MDAEVTTRAVDTPMNLDTEKSLDGRRRRQWSWSGVENLYGDTAVGRANGRTELAGTEWMAGRTAGRIGGRKGRMDGWTDGRMDGRMGGRIGWLTL